MRRGRIHEASVNALLALRCEVKASNVISWTVEGLGRSLGVSPMCRILEAKTIESYYVKGSGTLIKSYMYEQKAQIVGNNL